MSYTTVISPEDLAAHLDDSNWVVVDCRFTLNDTDAGRRAYREGHIPGAVYAHLDDDLSAPAVPGRTGRHPLPDIAAFAQTLGRWGVGEGVQVVVYDAGPGAIAARLWWMLNWLGHDAAAVLDGGFAHWTAAGYPVSEEESEAPERAFTPRPRPERVATATDTEAVAADPSRPLIDARGAERFRGEQEPIDPVAGHIPGAVSLPFAGNLTEAGRFADPEALRARFEPVVGASAEGAICYCGSGVTAAHDILAMAHAGLGMARLYPGSWSEWIIDATRGVAVGE